MPTARQRIQACARGGTGQRRRKSSSVLAAASSASARRVMTSVSWPICCRQSRPIWRTGAGKSISGPFSAACRTLRCTGPLRGNEPELGNMPPERIDELRALPHKALVRPERESARLFLTTLHCDKTQREPGCCCCNGRSIGKILLLPLQEELYMDRSDNAHLMAKCSRQSTQVMRRGAGLHVNNERLLIRQQLDRPRSCHRPVQKPRRHLL